MKKLSSQGSYCRQVPKRLAAYSPIHEHAELIQSTIASNPHISTKELYARLRDQGYQGKQTAAYTRLSRYKPRKIKVESTLNKSVRKYLTWRPAIICLLIYKPYSYLNDNEK